MRYWQSGAVHTLLVLLCLLLGAALVARLLPPLRRSGVPLSLLAGGGGLALGAQGLGWFALDVDLLEALVYHGLALVFIAVGLQAPSEGARTGGARAMGFAIVAMMSSQALLGLGLLLLLDPAAHPGTALLLPMGFEEGPGQALAMGATWEGSGLVDGAQIGLIMAAIGYGWCILAGVPLVLLGRRRGWVQPDGAFLSARLPVLAASGSESAGGLDALSVQAGLLGACYLLTWATCAGLARLLSPLPDVAAMIWGFHFIFGAGVAMLVRPLLARLPTGSPVDDRLMGRLAGLTVDAITCAAIAAIQLAVLRAQWLPILVLTTAGGLWTLLLSLWIARRAWTDAPFEHAVLWFGMSTGTLPTGLALLRVVDPDLRSPAAVSAVFGSAAAVVGLAPLMMLIFPATVASFGPTWPERRFIMLGLLAAYTALVFVAWRLVGGLRLWRPWASPWPPVPDQGPGPTAG